MLDNRDIKSKKFGGGLVSENPLSSAHLRAAHPLSLARPHASAASTLAKPQPSSAPPRTPAVSLSRGDTLWEVAQKKLGDATRWRELQKADGSRFTGQEARHLQVGTQVYLPGAKTTQTPHRVTRRSSAPRVSTQVLRPEGLTRREFTPGSTPLTKSTQFSASPVLLSKTSNISSNLLSTEGVKRSQWNNAQPSQPKPQKAQAIAPRGEQNKNNALNQTNSVIKGTLVGNAVANRKLSPTKAKDVLKLVDKSGIGKADLERRLKASGWIEVRGRWAKKSNPTSPIGSIWTNPARDESITIRPKKGGSFGVRGYDGPSGGAVNHLRQDPKNHKWKSQGSPGEGERPLIDEHPLDRRGRTGLKPEHIYDNAEKRTHFKLQPESRGVVKAFENSHVQGVARGASKVLAPVAVGLDAWQLGSAYKKDGFGPEFRQTAGSVAGGWGGAAAGAAGGAAIGSVVPVVGTAAGAIVGGIIGGVAGSEFGDDIEQKAEEVGKGIKDGAKKAWHSLFG